MTSRRENFYTDLNPSGAGSCRLSLFRDNIRESISGLAKTCNTEPRHTTLKNKLHPGRRLPCIYTTKTETRHSEELKLCRLSQITPFAHIVEDTTACYLYPRRGAKRCARCSDFCQTNRSQRRGVVRAVHVNPAAVRNNRRPTAV